MTETHCCYCHKDLEGLTVIRLMGRFATCGDCWDEIQQASLDALEREQEEMDREPVPDRTYY